jgi:U3 small nucleolar RNA-associated protein 3
MQNDINVRDWGKRKSAYYHGDTADLEIGQDADDALVEEEAAKEVQAARYKDMSERDFNLSDSEEQEQDDSIDEHVKKNKKLSSNSRHDKSHSSVVLASSSRLGASSSGNSSGGIGRLSKLSLQQQRKVLDRQHPEFLPILAHFSDVVRNFHQRTNVATRALLESNNNNNNIDSHDLQQAGKSAAQTTAEVSRFISLLLL